MTMTLNFTSDQVVELTNAKLATPRAAAQGYVYIGVDKDGDLDYSFESGSGMIFSTRVEVQYEGDPSDNVVEGGFAEWFIQRAESAIEEREEEAQRLDAYLQEERRRNELIEEERQRSRNNL